MSVAAVAGYPQHSGVLIPERWAKRILIKFYESTVLAEIANTEYEGEIASFGDTVHIRTTPDITIFDYAKGKKLDYETPQNENVDLLINRGKAFAFTVDDVDRFQSDYDFFTDWTRDGAEQLKIEIDTDVLGTIFVDAAPENQGADAGKISGNIDLGVTGSSVKLTSEDILAKILECGQVLDEQNIPETGRWIVLPAWAIQKLKRSDLAQVQITGDGISPLRNGMVGMIDRFTVYLSNLLTVTVDLDENVFNCIAGHKSALTFASQFTESEVLKAQDTFGWLCRGLQVYGFRVIKPEGLVWLYAEAAIVA